MFGRVATRQVYLYLRGKECTQLRFGTPIDYKQYKRNVPMIGPMRVGKS